MIGFRGFRIGSYRVGYLKRVLIGSIESSDVVNTSSVTALGAVSASSLGKCAAVAVLLDLEREK